ncbi:MAG: hypothetical protein R3E11_09060 [Sphingobium sp.]
MAGVDFGPGYTKGLDLSNPDVTTLDEKKGFWADKIGARNGKLMYPVSAYSFLLANRPDMLKYHLRQMQYLHAVPEANRLSLPVTTLTMLHWYSCNRVVEGIIHEVRASHSAGASKVQVNEIFALAFMHSGPSGFREVYDQAFDYMETFSDPSNKLEWPEGWEPDPQAFRSGIDFDNPDFGPGEVDLLETWYAETIGHTPRSVQFLIQQNPRFLKAHRAKFEAALKTGGLPKQIVPYILIHYNMNRGFREGIREAALLGKAWGMSKGHIIDAVTLGTGYMAGIDGVYVVDEAIGDLIDNWP